MSTNLSNDSGIMSGDEASVILMLHEGEMNATSDSERLFFQAMKEVIPALTVSRNIYREYLTAKMETGAISGIAEVWAMATGSALQVGCNFAVSLLFAVAPSVVIRDSREEIIAAFTRSLDRRLAAEERAESKD